MDNLFAKVVTTCNVAEQMKDDKQFADFVSVSLGRYLECDWGDLCDDDRAANDNAVKNEDRILASYEHSEHDDWKIWIITEWDRSVTTILFPSEY